MRKIVFIGVLSLMAGCISVPKETVTLSEELGEMIKSSEATHLALVDEYTVERKNRIDQFLKDQWLPEYMKEFTADSKIEEKLAEKKTSEERSLLMSQFTEAAVGELNKRQKVMYAAVDAVGDSLRSRVRAHYNDMRLTNESLTIYLRSASKVSKTRDELLKKANLPTKDIIPFDAINKSMEKIVTCKGKIEEVQRLTDETKAILLGGTRQ